MVQLRSVLSVADNSGVKQVRRIKVLGVGRRSGGFGRFIEIGRASCGERV